jgi:hypothetical protein
MCVGKEEKGDKAIKFVVLKAPVFSPQTVLGIADCWSDDHADSGFIYHTKSHPCLPREFPDRHWPIYSPLTPCATTPPTSLPPRYGPLCQALWPLAGRLGC